MNKNHVRFVFIFINLHGGSVLIAQILVILLGERQGHGCAQQDNEKMQKAWRKTSGGRKESYRIHTVHREVV